MVKGHREHDGQCAGILSLQVVGEDGRRAGGCAPGLDKYAIACAFRFNGEGQGHTATPSVQEQPEDGNNDE